jgi:inhibitor of cysteine peptidase
MAIRLAIRLFLGTALCVSVLMACSSTQAAITAGATCDDFAANPVIEQSRTIEQGADLLIVLCSNPSTGFSWGDPQVGDTTVVELASRTYAEPEASALPIVGQAGGEILTIRGAASGTTTLSIRYGQPWAGGAESDWSYVLDITVR